MLAEHTKYGTRSDESIESHQIRKLLPKLEYNNGMWRIKQTKKKSVVVIILPKEKTNQTH